MTIGWASSFPLRDFTHTTQVTREQTQMLTFHGVWQQINFLNKTEGHLGTNEQQLISRVQRSISLSRLLVDQGDRWISMMKLGSIRTPRSRKIPGYLSDLLFWHLTYWRFWQPPWLQQGGRYRSHNKPGKHINKRVYDTVSAPVLSKHLVLWLPGCNL